MPPDIYGARLVLSPQTHKTGAPIDSEAIKKVAEAAFFFWDFECVNSDYIYLLIKLV